MFEGMVENAKALERQALIVQHLAIVQGLLLDYVKPKFTEEQQRVLWKSVQALVGAQEDLEDIIGARQKKKGV